MASDRLTRVPARQALADFIRQCRERISPESLGLPQVRRRRTRGLRREEVAALAGVGLTWYTWFEQGRDIAVSDDFLHRLARGLRLDRAEREHLFALAGRETLADGDESVELPQSLVRMINALDQAAYIMNSSWDVLAHNEAARILFEDFKLPQPNLIRIVFFSDHYRQSIQDWQFAARLVLLKARHDYLTGGKSPVLRSILNEVLQTFPQTMEWWDDPEILPIGDTDITFCDAQGLWRSYRLNILVSKDRPGLRIAFYDEKLRA
ncbi:helix-turn-helix domain-containing protein [Azospirillum sp. YIM B02556]|uniref:Helix-turn-helix domain-containing protein n=1 Tax=Azospirillum endophyticum TaxID=2800326 RepID=A0ABS1F883_9PROT|nr:helix-turn-helix domain-containing protein [Azospirillum endophyticum]MBK1839639.1 helix-turn-helix domain-containing protein [Azospirillum endophyticum]